MKRRKRAGPCIMGNRARMPKNGALYVRFPRGCAGFRTFSRSYICASCTRRVKKIKKELGLD